MGLHPVNDLTLQPNAVPGCVVGTRVVQPNVCTISDANGPRMWPSHMDWTRTSRTSIFCVRSSLFSPGSSFPPCAPFAADLCLGRGSGRRPGCEGNTGRMSDGIGRCSPGDLVLLLILVGLLHELVVVLHDLVLLALYHDVGQVTFVYTASAVGP